LVFFGSEIAKFAPICVKFGKA